MLVHRCDNCKKIVKEESLALSYGFVRRIELCKTCAMPIIELVTDQQLLVPKLVKKLQASE
jgi:hypothetical protein